jgi:chromosome partitioning protein
MRHVMVLNAKGGCGKSTLSTNIAVFFARDGHKVCIADYDPQRSSLDWLAMRPADLPAISGAAAFEDGLRSVPRNTDILVIDAPARVHGTELNELVRRAETIIVPVLPSSIDMKACGHFMAELLEIGKVSRKQARLAVLANRVREYTLVYEELDQYLTKLKVPYLGHLRKTMCAPTRGAWGCWNCPNTSLGPIGNSGSRSLSGSTASAASPAPSARRLGCWVHAAA